MFNLIFIWQLNTPYNSISLEKVEFSEGKINLTDILTADNLTNEMFGSYFLAKIDITTQGPVWCQSNRQFVCPWVF